MPSHSADLSSTHLSILQPHFKIVACFQKRLQVFVVLVNNAKRVCFTENELYLRKEEQFQQLQARLDAAEAKLAAAPEPVSKKSKTAGDV